MKKLSRIKLKNAVVLENQAMKMIFGGSSGDTRLCGGSGYTHVCACTNGKGTWCGEYSNSSPDSAIDRHCGSGNGACRPVR